MNQTVVTNLFHADFVAMCKALGYAPEDVMNDEAKYLIVIEYLLM